MQDSLQWSSAFDLHFITENQFATSTWYAVQEDLVWNKDDW